MAKAVINLQKESGGIVKISPVDGIGITEVTVPESGNLVSVGTAVTDNAIARYDGTTGKLQDSDVTIDDNGNVGVGSFPIAKLSTLAANNGIEENIFIAGILGITNGFTISKDSVANPNYKFSTTSGATGLEISSAGDVLLKAGTGALGYGAGAGGTVTQLTSKGAAVTLNKPCGKIIMNNEALAAGATVSFNLSNSLIEHTDTVVVVLGSGPYTPSAYNVWTYAVNGLASIHIKNVSSSSIAENTPLNFSIIKGAIS